MPKLTVGTNLSDKAKKEVLSAYVYRWTKENGQRESAYKNLSKPTIPLSTDDEWLRSYAFWTNRDGSLTRNRHHCVPSSLVES